MKLKEEAYFYLNRCFHAMQRFVFNFSKIIICIKFKVVPVESLRHRLNNAT